MTVDYCKWTDLYFATSRPHPMVQVLGIGNSEEEARQRAADARQEIRGYSGPLLRFAMACEYS